MLMAYPLWILLRPLENFLPFFMDFRQNCRNVQKKKETYKNLTLGILIVLVDLILIILA